jgi:hypothetical protein
VAVRLKPAPPRVDTPWVKSWRTPLAFAALCGAFLVVLAAPTPASAAPARPTAVCANGKLVPELAADEACALNGGVPPAKSWYTEVQEARVAQERHIDSTWIVAGVAVFLVIGLFGALAPKVSAPPDERPLDRRDALLYVPENWSRAERVAPVFNGRRSTR